MLFFPASKNSFFEIFKKNGKMEKIKILEAQNPPRKEARGKKNTKQGR
jgi:hypothetical protein